MPQVFDISFREGRSGGDIDTDKGLQQAQALRGQSHVIFLVHGYNNDQHDAEVAYQAFCDREQAAVGAGKDWAPGAAVARVFWPGDARWWIAAPLFYPWAVPRALEIGPTLSLILEDLAGHCGGTLTVDFVGHSLGNRVLLHAIRALEPSADIWVRRVVHMAGAVPTWTLESEARIELLRPPLLRECGTDSKATSLFSEDDHVLSLAFPIGETAAETYDGELPVALGHGEWADGHQLPNLTQLRATGAGHSNYWGAKKKSAALDDWLRDTINTSLDLGNSAARSTPVSLQAERSTPEEREISERVMEQRAVG